MLKLRDCDVNSPPVVFQQIYFCGEVSRAPVDVKCRWKQGIQPGVRGALKSQLIYAYFDFAILHQPCTAAGFLKSEALPTGLRILLAVSLRVSCDVSCPQKPQRKAKKKCSRRPPASGPCQSLQWTSADAAAAAEFYPNWAAFWNKTKELHWFTESFSWWKILLTRIHILLSGVFFFINHFYFFKWWIANRW